jgi:hypothetical protein
VAPDERPGTLADVLAAAGESCRAAAERVRRNELYRQLG